eukprot:3829677-Rhodomonas_salina.1
MPVLLQPFVDRFGTCTKTVIFVLGGFGTLQPARTHTHCIPREGAASHVFIGSCCLGGARRGRWRS